MVKLETYRRRRRPDMTKCALAAAFISAALMAGLELGGSAAARAYSGLGGMLQAPAESSTAATAPVSAPR